jgi:membrane associated rhomboid family serine protease
MMVLGIGLVAFAIGSMLAHYSSPLNVPILGAVGAVLTVVGLLLLIKELMEVLSRGQTALVDGLQAG